MEITVNEQTQKFYLALDRWVDVVGHEITIGKYRFCAIPIKDHINVSEVTTGAKVYNIPVDLTIALLTQTKEDTIQFLYKVGESVKRIIEKQDDFDAVLADMKKIAFERLGDMPPIENVDTDWVIEDESEVLN
ncbi:hypothetical protein [Metabacillus litoralis]|uniref:hypothetical protein n=1 Tax=Metabacillus litoralis TaxID=152268 RepID=UPI00203C1667|nr:hypothetical protein [Metabacillus litoralis]MCM3413549.1 hypothetical protein [Metabacillus litoralis]